MASSLNMWLEQQRQRLRVKNADPPMSRHQNRRRHGDLLPDSIRCIISGPSNCGKTNLVVCLLLDANGLRYRNVYLYTKTPFQPKYLSLGQILNGIEGLGYHVFTENTEIVKPCDAAGDSVFVFDDVLCDKQNAMREYFSMGRHSTVDSFYLCQTYSKIPKQLIRDNANLIILFRQDETNLKHVYDDHVNTDMSFDEFKSMCALCWRNDKYGFLVIDKDSHIDQGRYRKGFDTYIRL